MAKDQYFVLSARQAEEIGLNDYKIAGMFDELGLARDFAKQAAKMNPAHKYAVTQVMAAFAAAITVNEI